MRPRLAIFVQNRVKGSNSIWTNFSFLGFIATCEFVCSEQHWSQWRIYGLPLTVDKTGKDAEWQAMGGGGCLSVFHLLHSLHWAHTCGGLTAVSEQFVENNRAKKKKKTGLKKAFRHFGWFLFFKNIILEQTQQKPETPGSGTMEVSVLVLKIMCHMDFQVSMWRMWLRAPVSWKICLYSSASVILKNIP